MIFVFHFIFSAYLMSVLLSIYLRRFHELLHSPWSFASYCHIGSFMRNGSSFLSMLCPPDVPDVPPVICASCARMGPPLHSILIGDMVYGLFISLSSRFPAFSLASGNFSIKFCSANRFPDPHWTSTAWCMPLLL
jgi:hypothetical protein